MKRESILKPQQAASCPGLAAVTVIMIVALQAVPSVHAAVNPYETITARNVFGIKPPATPLPPEPPKVAAPEIKLQGLTTILGNKLVLFKARIPAKPPELPQPKDMSFMLSEGERDGEIEVININEIDGVVKFRNYGVEQTLNLRENADKPVAVVAPISVPVPALPGVPTASVIPTGAGLHGGSAVTTIGSDINKFRSIPTRNPRTGYSTQSGGFPSGAYLGGGATQSAQHSDLSPGVHNMSPEVQTILIEANRATAKTPQEAAMLPVTVVTPREQPTQGATP